MIYAGDDGFIEQLSPKASPTRRDAFGKLEEGNRLFIAGICAKWIPTKILSNANSTPRITYGK